MSKLKIIEHISLDGVIQLSPDEDAFPYGPRPCRSKKKVRGDEFTPGGPV